MKLRYKILNSIFVLLVVLVAALAVTISYTKGCAPKPTALAGGDLMQAVMYRCYGSPDVLSVEDIAKPVPAADEVLVKNKAASVNPLDWHQMRGSPYVMRLMLGIGKPKESLWLGTDFAGVVESVGEDVTNFKPGDEVFGGAAAAFSEYVKIKESKNIVHKPDVVSFEQAAALPVAGLTALQAVRDHGLLKPGQKVLINGASGGVGTYAVQIAKAMGAEVDGVCSTRNVQLVKGIGADHVFDYKKENYTQSDVKYDLIVDMVGNHPVSANRRALKPEGRLVIVGGEKGDWIAPLKLPFKAMLLNPFVDEELITFTAKFNTDDLNQLAKMAADGEVTSVIDRRYSADQVADAIRYSETGRARGKIIIQHKHN